MFHHSCLSNMDPVIAETGEKGVQLAFGRVIRVKFDTVSFRGESHGDE